ncbi:hypothetical protein [Clostridium scatologenes]|uniref:Uncharacterized protein n=1 Tax=Clostridium scatologenes TaxID=1548 RepID=A0A0E3M5Z7_CLOSL|nr:hypothetical protein [Clostridium scatologenes]AKA68759.1 hypothetical protein CSCA_1634 [Clostridium scatologenes]
MERGYSYNKKLGVCKAIYLIIDNGHPWALENFYRFHNNLPSKIKQNIPFVVIDGVLNKESAIKASGMS